MRAVFGGFDSVARFNIISMVSPVYLHTASSQTYSAKLTAHAHKPQGGWEKDREREIAQRRINVHLKLTSDLILNLQFLTL